MTSMRGLSEMNEDIWVVLFIIAAVIGFFIFIYIGFYPEIIRWKMKKFNRKDKDGKYLLENGSYEASIKRRCKECGSNVTALKVSEDQYGHRIIEISCKECGKHIHTEKFYKKFK
jgi:hypothetical protein